MDPEVIAGLVNDAIKSVIDLEQWEKGKAVEEAVVNKINEALKSLAENFVRDIGDIGVGYGKDRDRTIKVQRWDELQANKKQEFEDVRILIGLKQPPIIRRR